MTQISHKYGSEIQPQNDIFQTYAKELKQGHQKAAQSSPLRPPRTAPEKLLGPLKQTSKTGLVKNTNLPKIHNLGERCFRALELVSGTLVIYRYILESACALKRALDSPCRGSSLPTSWCCERPQMKKSSVSGHVWPPKLSQEL